MAISRLIHTNLIHDTYWRIFETMQVLYIHVVKVPNQHCTFVSLVYNYIASLVAYMHTILLH